MAAHPLRALLIEDQESDAELLLRELRHGGYDPYSRRVQTAPALQAALQEEKWDIIFSDWSMPELGAHQALAICQSMALHVPFVFVSGTVGEEVAVSGLRGGARDFVSKDRLTRLLPAVERELRAAVVGRESARVQAELAISERMASIGFLAAGVAHEINNPLTSMLANLEMAAQSVADLTDAQGGRPELVELAEVIKDARDSATHVRRIARDLKVFSRVPTDELVSVDVNAAIESSLRMTSNEIRFHARLKRDFSPVPPVRAEESKLCQVLLNLLMNAAQAIPAGHAEDNEISIATAVTPDGRVSVAIRDSGPGISPEVLAQLFTPFFTTKPVGVGTGLGLSICHRIITSFGGEIAVESTVGSGSLFRVTLRPF